LASRDPLGERTLQIDPAFLKGMRHQDVSR
jgi:hypothetical protein